VINSGRRKAGKGTVTKNVRKSGPIKAPKSIKNQHRQGIKFCDAVIVLKSLIQDFLPYLLTLRIALVD
jgi:hypothetical protein